jgi:hypothetical protein
MSVVQPAACSECLNCGVEYGTKLTKEPAQESTTGVSSNELKLGSSEEEDDEKEVSQEEERSLPRIEPMRMEGDVGLPLGNIQNMEGRRDRIFCVHGHQWSEYWAKQFAFKWSTRKPLSWEEGVFQFLRQRLRAMTDVFYNSCPDATGLCPNLSGNDGGEMEKKVLYMKACPSPLPERSKRVSAFCSDEAKWVRGWHGASPYAVFAILDEGALRPGPRRKGGRRAVYQHLDDTCHKAADYCAWAPLFED